MKIKDIRYGEDIGFFGFAAGIPIPVNRPILKLDTTVTVQTFGLSYSRNRGIGDGEIIDVLLFCMGSLYENS